MKKTYLNPETQVAAMMPQSIICGSGVPGQLNNSGQGTAGSDMGGGDPVIVVGQ